MDFDKSEIRWRKLDGNHGDCATRCINCGGTREIYSRDPDEMFRCEDCDTEWMPEERPMDLNAEIARRQAIADCGPMIHRETTRALKLAVAALEQIDTNEWGHVTADGQDNDVAIALEATAARALEAIVRALEGK